MSKKYKNQTCVYCSAACASTADHVFAREFFLVRDRGGLPKVPACSKYNQTKSQLEHYLTTILPFGGRHATATENLETLVPKRLRKNERLRRELGKMQTVWTVEGGLHRPAGILPLNRMKIRDFYSLIARGLLWFHWKTLLRESDSVNVTFLTAHGEEFVNHLFDLRAANRVSVDLGDGTVKYEGVQATDPPQLSLWKVWFYGGFTMGEDGGIQTSRTVGMITGPSSISEILSD